MAKAAAVPRKTFRCQACGQTEAKWLGRCPSCGEWNCFIEEGAGAASRPRAGSAGGPPVSVAVVEVGETAPRRASGIAELDRVLGGGLVAGALVLLGGDPGIGKSTLLLQALDGLARRGAKVLYASGEESVAQTGMRARRLGAAAPSLMLCAETSLERILAQVDALAPDVLAIDSIQTVHTESEGGIPGSVTQVRECAGRLMAFAKGPGSVVVASADGTRPLLVEVQALVAPAAAGIGRRTATGFDPSRVSLLLAVLAERAGLDVLTRDVFVNVAGGLRLGEPAVDLGVA